MKTIKWQYDWTPDGATLAEGDSPHTFASIEFNPAINDEAQADIMHKITAAPELLAALIELCEDKYLADPINADRMKNARSAIQKAQGEA